MDSERWKRIDEIFHAALNREASTRVEFLAEACKGDDSLLKEVEGLIAAHDNESSLFENSPADVAEHLARRNFMREIAHYRILKKIGSGGMGEVYLAEDTRLNRKVALKLLPSEFTKDQERIRRFEREAHAVSALNHPNILTIYDIGKVESSSFIASEYIDGDTLRQRIRVSKMPLKEILVIGIQIAEALDAAHCAGIIHRDIKPENIMLRKDGYVKVLDFGLAKLTEIPSKIEGSNIETLDRTQTGIVIGTVRYMSPEQARGLKVDARTDIFSLGVVLYELITGRVPFEGATSADVLAAILEKHPPALRTYGEFPEELQWIVTKALAKDAEERYQTVKELLTDLKRIRKRQEIDEELKHSDASAPKVSEALKPQTSHLSRVTNSRPKKILRWVIGFGALLILLISIVFFFTQRTTKSAVVPEYHQATFTGKASKPGISPDGKFIAYLSGTSLIVQDIAGGLPLELYKNEYCDLDEAQPRWSPDGSQLAFTIHGESEEGVLTIHKLGGASRRITSKLYFPAWSPDGSEVALWYGLSKEILFKNLLTGATRSIPFKRPFTYIRDLDWSSPGKLLLLTFDEKTMASQIWTINANGSQQQKILENHGEITTARWAGNGKGIYYLLSKENTKNLLKIPIEGNTVQNTTTKTLLTGLEAEGVFSVSRNGKQLAYSKEFSFSNLWLATFEDLSGKHQFKTKQLTTGTSNIKDPSFSPDGSRIAFSMGNSAKANLYIMQLLDGSLQQITFMNSFNTSPAWSPDGKRIAFASSDSKKTKVWVVRSDGEDLREFSHSQLSNNSMRVIWAPGAQILYQRSDNRNFHLLNPETEIEKRLIDNESVGWIFSPRFSQDGTKVVAFWNRRSVKGLYIISLIDSSQTLLKEGLMDPIGWSKDGNWIYTIDDNGVLSKISVFDSKTVQLPDLPFKDKLPALSEGPEMDISADGNHFIFSVPEKQPDVWIVENFDPDVLAEDSPPQ